MARVLYANYFDGGLGRGGMYDRLARVLRYSARRALPSWTVEVVRLDRLNADDIAARFPSAAGNLSHSWNSYKLEDWAERVSDAKDGDELLLIDGDTAVLAPLDEAWALDFDIAYTVRPRGLPFNGGVLFLRISPGVRDFVEEWLATNHLFLGDRAAHAEYHARYAGINQASFGRLLELDYPLRFARLDCRVWNACSPDLFSPTRSKILHVKSKFRTWLFASPTVAAPNPLYARAGSVWRRLEGKANADATRP